MRSNTNYPILIIVICSLFSIVNRCFSMPPIINYDNHPDLKKAMEYDLTMNMKMFNKEDGTFDQALYDSYVKNADGKKAEQYYLSYLKDVNESFQRARVYEKLGRLYSGGIDQHVIPSVGIDDKKSIMYYRKVLEEEPNRIGDPTLDARATLISESKNPEERFALYMDYYEFLLSIDAEKLQENYLPFMPGNTKLSDRVAKQMMDGIVARRETSEFNLVYEAIDKLGRMRSTAHHRPGVTVINLKYLIELIDRFPEARFAEIASKELEKTIQKYRTRGLEISLELEEKEPADDSVKLWRETFIPAISIALKNRKPFVFDLASSLFLNASVKNEKLDTQEAYDYMTTLNKGDIAWDGSIVTTRGALVYAIKQEINRPLNPKFGRWSNSYELPKEVELPYTFFAINKEGKPYIIRILEIRPDGIKIKYKKLNKDEVKVYRPFKKKSE